MIKSWVFLSRSTFSDFAQKYNKDERFKGIEKMRERESLFNEYILELRKKEKEERFSQREKVSEIDLHIFLIKITKFVIYVNFVTSI